VPTDPPPAPDCKGVPGGSSEYDRCDVCDGDGESCVDCCGEPFGNARFDDCGVCDGLDRCLDCKGVPNGSNRIDRCGVCGGCDACLDCPDSQRDVCGVCSGDGRSCLDCDHVPNGTKTVDACGVCGGDGSSCIDCAGMPITTGPNQQYDECGVCGGDGSSCADCAGVPNGTSETDPCDVCGGSGDCLDCAGVPYGLGCYDECDVCNGDGSSCLDCDGVRFGTNVVDMCGICNGPNTDRCDEAALAQAIGDYHGDSTTLAYTIVVGLCLCVLGVVGVYLCYFFGLLGRAAPTRRQRRANARIGRAAVPQDDNDDDDEDVRAANNNNAPRRQAAGAGSTMIRGMLFFALLGAVTGVPRPLTAAQTALCTQGLLSEAVCGSYICDTNVQEANNLVCGLFDEPRRLSLRGNQTQVVSRYVLESVAPTLRVLHLFNVTVELTADTLKRMRHLESLRLIDCNLLHTDFLCHGLECNTKLQVIEIRGGGLQLEISSEFHQLQQLTELTLAESAHVSLGDFDACFFGFLAIIDWSRSRAAPPPGYCFPQSLRSFAVDGTGLKLDLEQTPQPYEFPDGIEHISLANNHITGLFVDLFPAEPDYDYSSLSSLSVANNKLTGLFPTALCKSPDLFELDVSYNQIQGALPDCLLMIGPLQEAFFENNRIGEGVAAGESPLPDFTEDNFAGECNFNGNLICEIPSTMRSLGCKFQLLPDGCSGGCGDRSCFDCLGTVDGQAELDACGVCAGDDSTCTDCAGEVNGSAVYDACDVCNGDDSTCTDCAGVPNGPARYDRCSVCGGDDSLCSDCNGVPFGSSVYDRCDVCNGQNKACRDCLGVINGSAKFDECGVCEGDGLSCASKIKQDIVMAQRGNAPGRWQLLQVVVVVGAFVFCGLGAGGILLVNTRRDRLARR